jgi:hypothetical protein
MKDEMTSDKRSTFIMVAIAGLGLLLYMVHQVLLALSRYNAHLDKHQLYADLVVPFVVPLGIFGLLYTGYYLIQGLIDYHTSKTIIADDMIEDVEDLKYMLHGHRKMIDKLIKFRHNHKD